MRVYNVLATHADAMWCQPHHGSWHRAMNGVIDHTYILKPHPGEEKLMTK
jgi:hypothetical protein